MTTEAPAIPDAAPTHLDLQVDESQLLEDAVGDEMAPSRQDLLARAAALGPARRTWESIILSPSDPILGAKMQPRVAERRARFRKIVKVALGTCVACCFVATAATALSSSSATGNGTRSSVSNAAKSAPAAGSTPVEKLEIVMRTKAPSHTTAAARVAPAPRWGKRR
jgi:hypothetical protein